LNYSKVKDFSEKERFSIIQINKGEIMYLPKTYEDFSDKFPEIFKDYQQLGKSCREAGPLEEKNQDLIKLGIAVGANSRGAVMSSVRKALASGSTPDEIIHAVLLSLTTTGFPNMIAALGWVNEVLEKHLQEK
jgi:alkylhydroperoxidase/carboxymuconolactone decarboxylase family protein YurZ